MVEKGSAEKGRFTNAISYLFLIIETFILDQFNTNAQALETKG